MKDGGRYDTARYGGGGINTVVSCGGVLGGKSNRSVDLSFEEIRDTRTTLLFLLALQPGSVNLTKFLVYGSGSVRGIEKRTALYI